MFELEVYSITVIQNCFFMISMADYKCNSPTKVRIISRMRAKSSKIIWLSEDVSSKAVTIV